MIRVFAWANNGSLRYEYFSNSDDPVVAGQEAADAITKLLRDQNRITDKEYLKCWNHERFKYDGDMELIGTEDSKDSEEIANIASSIDDSDDEFGEIENTNRIPVGVQMTKIVIGNLIYEVDPA